MDEIEFVIAEDRLGGDPLLVIEPVINGLSLVEIVKNTNGHRYGGVWHKYPADRLGPSPTNNGGEVLCCACGCDGCGWVRADVEFSESQVVWSRFRRDSSNTDLATLGPYRFDRVTYERSLREPTPRDSPLRSVEWIEPV